MVAGVELVYDIGATALQMAQTIFGNGVTVVGASYTGDNRASAIYSSGDTISPGVVPSDTGVILSTGRADGFTRTGSQSNASTRQTTSNNGPNNDPDFNALAGRNTYDASFLEVDFIPDPGVNVMSIDFVFSSEEYPEYSNSIYNDQIGVWVDGNLVPLSVGNGDTSVTNISPINNINLYNDNTSDQYNTEMDGFTIKLTLTFPVNAGVVNSVKIGIADVGDNRYDSNLLIAANSAQGTLVATDDVGTIFPGGSRTIDVLSNDVNLTGGTLTVTHINGQPVSAGDTITTPAGQTVTLNADGTITFGTDADIEEITFTYGVTSSTGETDTGFVDYTVIPCFTAGTWVETPGGPRKIETLRVGNRVTTADHGARQIRWTGRRLVRARGSLAPVRIRAGTLGDHDTIMVSPLHRVMVTGYLAELYFGEDQVLAAARDLVNGGTIERVEGGWVEYVHLLFDAHEVIWANELLSESFLPGPEITNLFEEEAVSEIRLIFPELDPASGAGYVRAARRTVRAYEAGLLRPVA